MASEKTTRARSNVSRSRTTTATSTRLLDNSEELKASFAIELDSFGRLNVGAIKEQRFYSVKNHAGDISSLIEYANAKAIRSRASFKSVTTWHSTATPRGFKNYDATSYNTLDIPSSASIFTVNDFDEIKVDSKLLHDFQYLIQFCFKALGKSGSSCPKLPTGFDFFTVFELFVLKISSKKVFFI